MQLASIIALVLIIEYFSIENTSKHKNLPFCNKKRRGLLLIILLLAYEQRSGCLARNIPDYFKSNTDSSLQDWILTVRNFF